MNREEILEKSRRENRGMDERERDAFVWAGQKATAVGGLLCAVIIVLEAIFSDHVSFSTWAVYLSMTGTTLLGKYIRLREKHELVFGFLQISLAAIFFIMYVVRLVR